MALFDKFDNAWPWPIYIVDGERDGQWVDGIYTEPAKDRRLIKGHFSPRVTREEAESISAGGHAAGARTRDAGFLESSEDRFFTYEPLRIGDVIEAWQDTNGDEIITYRVTAIRRKNALLSAETGDPIRVEATIKVMQNGPAA